MALRNTSPDLQSNLEPLVRQARDLRLLVVWFDRIMPARATSSRVELSQTGSRRRCVDRVSGLANPSGLDSNIYPER